MTPHEDERLARIETQIENLSGDLRELVVLLNGPPRAESIRGRLHALEGDRTATEAATAALEAAHLIRTQNEARAFGRREKLVALGLASVMAVCMIVTLILAVMAQAHR